MPSPTRTEAIRCNGRKSGYGGRVPKAEPGPWEGEGYCGQWAGWGTDHPGEGRCKYHDGRPPTHGRYSRYLKTQLGDMVEQFREDPDPLDLTEEVHLARALLRRALDAEGLTDSDRMDLVSEVSKIVKRIEDIRSQDALSRPELARIYSEMFRAVQHHTDDETAQKIASAWSQIRL